MGDRKRKGKGNQNRVVYSEFGGSSDEALERQSVDLPPSEQKLRVQASRRGRGGKTVTVVSGFQCRPETLKDLLKKLKGQCGTGGTVKDDTLELQGDCADQLVKLLVARGYQAKRSGG
ncbi:MAG: translation initiation factor [Cyanobacteria bacterium P01_D01_bin.73]